MRRGILVCSFLRGELFEVRDVCLDVFLSLKNVLLLWRAHIVAKRKKLLRFRVEGVPAMSVSDVLAMLLCDETTVAPVTLGALVCR